MEMAFRNSAQQKLVPIQETPEQAKERILKKPERNSNRARIDNTVTSYTIAPRSNTDSAYPTARRVGAGGDDMFRRMKARQLAKAGGGTKR